MNQREKDLETARALMDSLVADASTTSAYEADVAAIADALAEQRREVEKQVREALRKNRVTRAEVEFDAANRPESNEPRYRIARALLAALDALKEGE